MPREGAGQLPALLLDQGRLPGQLPAAAQEQTHHAEETAGLLGKGRLNSPRAGGEEAAMEDQQQRYERARAHVQAIKGFYIHASVFVVVNLVLFIINAFTSGLAGGVCWFYWPLIGWGIGLGAHALGVFGFGGGGPFGQEWEERKTREMMDKEGGS